MTGQRALELLVKSLRMAEDWEGAGRNQFRNLMQENIGITPEELDALGFEAGDGDEED